jgi:hypothetical protein
MKIFKKLVTVWLMIFSFPVLLFGANPEKPISLQIKNLTRWKNSSEAPAVQQSLGALLKSRQNDLQITKSLKGMKQYTSIFQNPFLLLETEPNSFGGFFALVVFKSYPKVLRLWIYEIDKNIFEIREILPLQVTLNKRIMNEFEDKRIAPFWLTSLPR